MSNKVVSLVLPVYNEAESLPELWRVLQEVLAPLKLQYYFEFLFVNDGSRDRSSDCIKGWAKQDSGVKLISFSRNFGHQLAITAGLDYASGDCVIMMDTDLQHPPHLIPALLQKWEEGYEIVSTQRLRTEKVSFFKQKSSDCFYWFFNKITQLQLKAHTADFRLMSRPVVDSFCQIREQARFLRGLIYWIGYRHTLLTYEAPERFAGESKYTLRKMLLLALDAIFAFSAFPIHFITCFGLFTAFFSALYAFYAIYLKLFTPIAVQGWASVLVAVLFLGGCQLVTIGVLGEYINRIYNEVKQRPLYVVQEWVGLSPHPSKKA
jgi:glycosyltransferase involved in cell wall biosynthesis